MAQKRPKCLLLGLGGTGSRIINYVATDLNNRGIRINDGNICCAVIDTNGDDQEKIKGTGSGIPVLATSKPRKVKDYMIKYGRREDSDEDAIFADDWMPMSAQLADTDMTSGAAQMRVKSRLAFYDTIKDGSILGLEKEIEKLFQDQDNKKVTVMIVSSIAGGTGAGMFIQTAMWVRKFFERMNCGATIRGILVLPDVFIRTIKGIRDDEGQCRTLRANAYGAIRELNAITKVRAKSNKKMNLINPIVIDEVDFDSVKNSGDGKSVFDYAFFMGDVTAGGSALNSIKDYEKAVARLVYMQLIDPMSSDMRSEEDNLLRNNQKEPEPLYGACGTAKAVYPADSILEFCSLKAAKDALNTGWTKIDKNIDTILKKEKERKEDGFERTNPRTEYIRQFDNLSAKNTGQDKLLYKIRNDINNESISNENGSEVVTMNPKDGDFKKLFTTMIDDEIAKLDPGKLSSIKISGEKAEDWISESKEDLAHVDDMKEFVEGKKKATDELVKIVDAKISYWADDIANAICPVDMGEVSAKTPGTVLNLFTKKDEEGNLYFVHPIAIRYLTYKLSAFFEEEMKKRKDVDKLRAAIKDEDKKIERDSFDNLKTKGKRETALEALEYKEQKSIFQSESAFLKAYMTKYFDYNKKVNETCKSFVKAALKLEVSAILVERMNTIIKVMEGFFKDIDKVHQTLDDKLAANVRESEDKSGKVFSVCASQEDKEALYDSFNFNADNSNERINEVIANAFYAQLCAKANPEADFNEKYVGKSVIKTFETEVIKNYGDIIRKEYGDEIYIDLYTAVCKSSDLKYKKEYGDEEEDSDARQARRIKEMKELVRQLESNSAPFLNVVDDPYRLTDVTRTYWGISPALAEACPQIGEILGVNSETQKDDAYDKCELNCYQARYGILAENISMLNEENTNENNNYYVNYERLVNEMKKGVADGDNEVLVQTPHLDKTWHKILPFISVKKRIDAQVAFFRNFWLAVAYGMITVNKEGQYQIARTKRTAMGAYKVSETLKYRGRAIFKTEISKLIELLQLDDSFERDVDEWDDKFKEEISVPGNYVDTKFLNGLTVKEECTDEESSEIVKNTIGGVASKGELNALTLMTRYLNSTGYDETTLMSFRQALEELCEKIGYKKHAKSATEGLARVKYDLCKRIYDACQLKDKDTLIVDEWKKMWTQYGLI